eukprot:TRINITY_DN23403_c0_g1_i2.p1 TRINITY_DN23403_c0_g1~~TRINITY_DN23403_c0_g1_i2.p1  ORF type:complete len:216 (+),score=84.56 TRINITY_DN23403_c0_g1_i2:99-746(+)
MVLADLQNADVHKVFWEPVTGVDDYHEVIKEPMDFSTMRKKAKNGQYQDDDEFEADLLLMFNNCRKFSPAGSFWHDEANRLQKVMTDDVFPRYGMEAAANIDSDQEDEEASRDEAEFEAVVRQETEMMGGEDNAREARKKELDELEANAKMDTMELLKQFGDPEAILKASRELQSKSRLRKAGGDDAPSESSSSSESDEEDSEGSGSGDDDGSQE